MLVESEGAIGRCITIKRSNRKTSLLGQSSTSLNTMRSKTVGARSILPGMLTKLGLTQLESKVLPFRRIKDWSAHDFSDMVCSFFTYILLYVYCC
jgi:hypothetical protein